MYAIVYNADEAVIGFVEGASRPNLKNALREFGFTKPGNSAVFVTSLKSRTGVQYKVGSTRRQWYRHDSLGLTTDEREYLQGQVGIEGRWVPAR